MPYVSSHQKSFLDPNAARKPLSPCELNYLITTVCRDYFNRPNGGDYQAINDVLGALEGAKLEFYRRVVVPYEDENVY